MLLLERLVVISGEDHMCLCALVAGLLRCFAEHFMLVLLLSLCTLCLDYNIANITHIKVNELEMMFKV